MKKELFIGNKTTVDFLAKNLIKKKTAQAYLFIGPKQVGKRTLANLFSQVIFCQHSKSHETFSPCQNCPSCQQWEKGIHSDFLILNKEKNKKNISIEEVRSFQHQLNTTSLLGKKKIGLIDEADNLSKEGASALLKILEEPPLHSMIILITASPSSLPATVSSRCQKIIFQLVPRKEIIYHLEQLGCSKEKAEKLACLSLGRPGKAIDFLKHPALLQKYEEIQEEFLQIFKKNVMERFFWLKKSFDFKYFQEKIKYLNEIINIWLIIVRDLLLIKENKLDYLVHYQLTKTLKLTARNHSRKELMTYLHELFKIKEDLTKNINPQLALENYFLNIKTYA